MLIMCEKGHYYDSAKYGSCPYCGISLTRPVAAGKKSGVSGEDGVTMRGPDFSDERTISAAMLHSDDDEKTVGIYRKEGKSDPVVGWLVCISGGEKGRDYRLHAGRNFIGRSPKMDISIFDDPGVSRENHASIVYDPRDNEFYAMAGENSLHINNEPVQNGQKLCEDDIMEIGASQYAFIKFCKGERTWES